MLNADRGARPLKIPEQKQFETGNKILPDV